MLVMFGKSLIGNMNGDRYIQLIMHSLFYSQATFILDIFIHIVVAFITVVDDVYVSDT
jgi:hypothetical protein